jgi:hypothetical protein
MDLLKFSKKVTVDAGTVGPFLSGLTRFVFLYLYDIGWIFYLNARFFRLLHRLLFMFIFIFVPHQLSNLCQAKFYPE